MKDHLCDLDAADRVLECKEVAPATYCGRMGDAEIGYLELWDLTEDIPGHCAGSTVTEGTLRKMGYAVPSRRLTDGEIASRKI